MTFNNPNNKKTRDSYSMISYSTNSSDNEANKYINQLQQIFHDFDCSFEELKEYNKKMSTYSEKDYLTRSGSMHEKINGVHGLLKNINNILQRLESIEIYDVSIRNKAIESTRLVNSRIRPKQEELSNLINEISKKEKARNEALVMSMRSMSNSVQSSKRQSDAERLPSMQIQYKESLIDMKDLAFNEQINAERETELKNLQIVSNQIKDMSLFMTVKVKEQGTALSKFYIIIINRQLGG